MGEWTIVIILILLCGLLFGGVALVINKVLTGDVPHFNRKWER